MWKIFSSIADEKGIQRAVLINRLDKSARTIDGYLSELKDKNLVEHARGYKGGYHLTERGIVVFRKMIKLMAEKEERKAELLSKDKILSIKALEQPEEEHALSVEKRLCYIGKLKALKENGDSHAKTAEMQ